MKEKDIDKFIKSHQIVEELKANIKNGDDELCQLHSLDDNENRHQFIENITSESFFKAMSDELQMAYDKRDLDGFTAQLNKRKQQRRNRLSRIVAMTAATAAALVTIYFSVNIKTEDIETITASEELIERSEKRVEVPTIISSDTVIKLRRSEKNIVNVSDIVVQNISELRLVVPNGYIYTLILSDSSEVIVNSGSELIYPPKFTKEKREVAIIGEAYFKVKKNSVPFIVRINSSRIKVYGTEFNVNSYNQDSCQTVLVEGLIGIATNGVEQIVKPNQKSTISSKGKVSIKNVDVSKYIAWIGGDLVSDNEPITNLLNKIARWYNIEFIIHDNLSNICIDAEIKNSQPLNEILRSIEQISEIKFTKIEEGKYMVKL